MQFSRCREGPIKPCRNRENGIRLALGTNFESVLQAARLGADWAWTAIYRDLSPDVLRYVRVQGANEPEDVLGEAFLNVVRRLENFEGGESEFRAWVFTIARNSLIDAWRRDGRRPVDYMAPDTLPTVGVALSAEDDVMQHDSYGRVVATLSSLSSQQREVVFLRLVVGLSIEETARVLDNTPGAVKSLQSRGLAAIRREISKEAVSE